MTKNEHLFKFLFVLTTVQNSYIVMEQVKKEAQKVKNERSRRTDEKNQLIFQMIETLEPFKNEIDLPNFLEGLFDETVPPDRFMSIWLEVTSDYLQDFFHIQEKIRGCFETYKAILKLETKQKVEPLFIPVQFVSVWNFGEYSFSTEAKFDKINNIVFDIEQVDTDNLDLKQLDKEYILFLDGKKFDIERTIGEKQEMIQLKNYQMESEA